MRIYKYVGNIGSHSVKTSTVGVSIMDMIVDDINDESKAPARLTAYGKLAEYLRDLFDTDDEEQYLTKEFYFDSNLDLECVVISSPKSDIPAKAIVPKNGFKDIEVFGDDEHIATSRPEPMDHDEYSRYLAWKIGKKMEGYCWCK